MDTTSAIVTTLPTSRLAALLALLAAVLCVPVLARPAEPLLQYTSQGHVLGFREDGYFVSNGTYALRVGFVAANAVAPTSDSADSSDDSTAPSPGAKRSQNSSAGAPPLSKVTYPNLWDGVTVSYDGTRGGIVRSSYRVEPHADPRAIRLRYNGPVKLNDDGTLSVKYETGRMTETAPVAWQDRDGARVPVSVSFRLSPSAIRNPQSAIRNRFLGGQLRRLAAALH
jgi:hypothetical protein